MSRIRSMSLPAPSAPDCGVSCSKIGAGFTWAPEITVALVPGAEARPSAVASVTLSSSMMSSWARIGWCLQDVLHAQRIPALHDAVAAIEDGHAVDCRGDGA